MNILVVVASLTVFSAAGSNFLTPGDNSGYVEGVSRYIWMSDGEELPQLVDLKETVDESLLRVADGSNNQYWLYTRENPSIHQLLIKGNTTSVKFSNYSPFRPTKVVSHGWHNNGQSDVNTHIRDAFLEVLDCNVIVVDWSDLSADLYAVATLGVPSVGEHLGDFLVWLFNYAGGNWNDLHLIGHSLGAHVVGNAGRQTGGLPRRITGLDPAGPLWIGNSHALDKECARYVEIIHTDGGILGILYSLGHVDFYPNGGAHPQPGCLASPCSHGRSYEFFAASVRYDKFVGKECSNMLEVTLNLCSGETFNMGNSIISKIGSGIYRLDTEGDWPYVHNDTSSFVK